jgi:hypothetical protein
MNSCGAKKPRPKKTSRRGRMRSHMSPRRDARRRLRSVLWQEWTRPQFGGSDVDPVARSVLGLTSHRDECIRARVRRYQAALEERTAKKLREYLPEEVEDELVEFATTGFDPVEIQAGGHLRLARRRHPRSEPERPPGRQEQPRRGWDPSDPKLAQLAPARSAADANSVVVLLRARNPRAAARRCAQMAL